MSAKRKKILTLDSEQKYQITEVSAHKKKYQKFSISLASEIGYSIAIPIALGALSGVWLDERFATHPKFTLSLLVTGIFFSFFQLYRIVKEITDSNKK
ncbi:AtpZ/AtpI family protein [Candidatus Microgenomates bacterium]|nr:MAG: AtpZ/AtpI family protein [Candidatus Microgenomates bacterium]